MKKSLFILFLAITATLGAKGALTADWILHMPYDIWPNQVVETPGRVYFTGRTFEYNPSLSGRDFSSNSLFYYDKQGNEIVSVNERTLSSGNAVAQIAYNAEKNYLLVIYSDSNIDFIYDDGRIFNLPALKATSIPGKKEANNISFDNAQSRVYIATTFGYVSLNDARHEVAESRQYGENIQSIARCGDNIVLSKDGKVFYAPVSSLRYSLSDYTPVEIAETADVIIPSPKGHFFAYKNSWDSYLLRFKPVGSGYEVEKVADDPNIFCVQQIKNGYCVTGNSWLYFIDNDGNITGQGRPTEDFQKPATSYNKTEIWCLSERKGLRSYKINGEWSFTMTRDFMRPNAPATYIATSFCYHPTYGMLAGSNGVDMALGEVNQSSQNNISALKGGLWRELGPGYTSSASFSNTNNYTGLAVDPQNPNHIYRSNTTGGIMRIDLANPAGNLIFANPSNPNSGSPNFITAAEDLAAWNRLCRFTVPQFSADGTMWTLYDNEDTDKAELWYWPAADRLATTGKASYRPMKKIIIPKFPTGSSDVMMTLNNHKNMVVIGGFAAGGTFMIYDHNGTPEKTSDDRYVHMSTPTDQDGGSVNFQSINSFYEDPATGLVWIMSQRGLFTVNPATVFNEPNRVNRIKVARNDGTNLADYLLNEINVHSMSIDAEGRKWFSTSNGLVCTSSDGRTILAEFTTDNSYLPSNVVYATCFNPENNSMMVATDAGLVEMFPSGSGSSATADGEGMRIYPNPVEPNFYGWVRIDNINDGSLVKITDTKGGVVKELGPAEAGSVEWDVSGLNNTRVSTGVYYIMVSPPSGGEGKTQIAKILVLN